MEKEIIESGLPNEKDLELLYLIINKALEGKHTKFELLRNQDELRNAKLVRRASRGVIKKLRIVADNVFNVYLANIRKRNLETLVPEFNSADMLLEYKKIDYSIKFYQEELKSLKHIIKEFRVYRFYHKWRVWVLNEERPDSEMVDWTKIPFTWF